MKKSIEVFISSSRGEEEYILVPSEERIARLRYSAQRARNRARQATEALQNLLDHPAENRIDQELQQDEIAQLKRQRSADLEVAVGLELLANEEATWREQVLRAVQAGQGQLEAWTYEVPPFGYDYETLVKAEEYAREWDEEHTVPRRNEYKFRMYILEKYVPYLLRPHGEKVILSELSDTWRVPIWDSIWERSQGGTAHLGFILSSWPDSGTAKE